MDKQTLKKPTNSSEAFAESNLEINNSHNKGDHMTTNNSQNETLTQATGIIAATNNTATLDDSTVIAGDYVADAEAIKQQTSAMDVELNNMKQSAADVQKHFKLGNLAHYTHLVVMVLFWIQADKISGYLKNLYESKLKKSFKTNVNHGINFAPLLATVWEGIDCEVMTNKHNRNSRAMNAILNEYNENAEKYAVNTVDQLVAFVKDKGGINGLIDTGKQISAEKNTSDLEADMALCKSTATQDAEEIAKLSQEGLNHVQSSTSYACS